MNINSMLDLASTNKTTASKPSKGNSKTSDTLFQSILGQKSQGRDTTKTAVQPGRADADSKPQQTQNPSKSDKPADINSDQSANDVTNEPQVADTEGTEAEVTDETTEAADSETAAAEETGKTDEPAADAEEGTEAPAANMPFIVVPGPIIVTEVPKTVGPMEMVAAQPVIQQTTRMPDANLAQNTADLTAEMPVPEDASQMTVQTENIETDVMKTTETAASVISTEADVPEANLELDPELARKLTAVKKDTDAKPQPAQVTDDTVRTAAEGNVDHAEHFAAQVVKEAKNLVSNNEEQNMAPIVEEAQIVTEDKGAFRPVEANEETALVQEDLDPEQDTKEGTAKTKENPVQHTAGTAHVADNGRVDFRMSGAQPLEAQPAAAPPEPPQVVLNKVVDQVRSVVTPDKTEFFVQLKPDHLGGLSIGLVAEDKGVVAKIMTSSQQVHAALQADMNQMVQMLRDKGINVVQMEIIYDQTANAMSQDQGGKGQQQFGQGHGRSHGRGAEQVDGTVSMYDTLSSYEVLAEQGGSVEFTA